jgi:chemotaxis protein histidine kinase CheA
MVNDADRPVRVVPIAGTLLVDDLLREFLAETAERMDELDQKLVLLERDPRDRELIGGIFRVVHTIKGTSGFLGLPRLESMAHAAEEALVGIREGRIERDSEAIALILSALDRIRELFGVTTEDQEDTRKAPLGAIEGDIVFENVSFEYNSGVPVLKNVSFHARAGSTTALGARSSPAPVSSWSPTPSSVLAPSCSRATAVPSTARSWRPTPQPS